MQAQAQAQAAHLPVCIREKSWSDRDAEARCSAIDVEIGAEIGAEIVAEIGAEIGAEIESEVEAEVEAESAARAPATDASAATPAAPAAPDGAVPCEPEPVAVVTTTGRPGESVPLAAC